MDLVEMLKEYIKPELLILAVVFIFCRYGNKEYRAYKG